MIISSAEDHFRKRIMVDKRFHDSINQIIFGDKTLDKTITSKIKVIRQNQGITLIAPTEKDLIQWRKVVRGAVDKMGREGLYSPALLEELRSHLRSGQLAAIMDNKKLSNFLKEIVIQRRTFDYVSLRVR